MFFWMCLCLFRCFSITLFCISDVFQNVSFILMYFQNSPDVFPVVSWLFWCFSRTYSRTLNVVLDVSSVSSKIISFVSNAFLDVFSISMSWVNTSVQCFSRFLRVCFPQIQCFSGYPWVFFLFIQWCSRCLLKNLELVSSHPILFWMSLAYFQNLGMLLRSMLFWMSNIFQNMFPFHPTLF